MIYEPGTGVGVFAGVSNGIGVPVAVAVAVRVGVGVVTVPPGGPTIAPVPSPPIIVPPMMISVSPGTTSGFSANICALALNCDIPRDTSIAANESDVAARLRVI